MQGWLIVGCSLTLMSALVYLFLFCVSDAMQILLEEECLREKKLREYEEGRAEVTRTLLSQ
jgi:protein-S-isoprenylcysteine O-methyltransferase Ste14